MPPPPPQLQGATNPPPARPSKGRTCPHHHPSCTVRSTTPLARPSRRRTCLLIHLRRAPGFAVAVRGAIGTGQAWRRTYSAVNHPTCTSVEAPDMPPPPPQLQGVTSHTTCTSVQGPDVPPPTLGIGRLHATGGTAIWWLSQQPWARSRAVHRGSRCGVVS